nr:glycosyl hydrolase [Actinomycetota bacterium]
MTAPSPMGSARPRRGWTVLTGALVALTVALGIVAVPWFLMQERTAPLAPAGPRWFGGYVDVARGQATADLTGGSPSDAVVLAFVGAATANACTASWGGAYSLADAARTLDLDRRVARMQHGGRRVAVSFGGAGIIELASACTSVGDLAGAYASVLDRYAVTTMDLDLGPRSLDDAVAGDRRAQAVAQVQANHRARGTHLAVWLTLPAGHGGLSTSGLRSIRQMQQAGVRLSGINAMTGDDAPQDGQTMGTAAIAALDAVHDQLGRLYDDLNVDLPAGGVWAIMGATPTIGRDDGSGGVFALADAAALNAFAQKQRLARLSMWSTNRDRACTSATDPVAGACSGIIQQDDAFASVLGHGLGAAADRPASAPPATAAPAPPASTPSPSPDP